MSYLGDILQRVSLVLFNGTALTARQKLNFKGAGVTVTDNADEGRTDVTIAAADLADAAPPAIATTAAVGVSTQAAREDHTHAHGNQAGGTLHAVASSTAAGFLTAAHYSLLAGADHLANPGGLVKWSGDSQLTALGYEGGDASTNAQLGVSATLSNNVRISRAGRTAFVDGALVVAEAFTASTYAAIGAGTHASAGAIRLVNGDQIMARGAGVYDVRIATVNASDNLDLGDLTNGTKVRICAKSGGQHEFWGGAFELLRVSSASGATFLTSTMTGGFGVQATAGPLNFISSADGVLGSAGYFAWRSAAGGERWRITHGVAAPTDATPVTVSTYAVPNGKAVFLEGIVTALNISVAEAAVYRIKAGVYRHSGGAATLIGTPVVDTEFETAGAAAWGATLVASGNDVLLQFTGAAATTIDVSGRLEAVGRMT